MFSIYNGPLGDMWTKTKAEIGKAQLSARMSARKTRYPKLTKREDQSSASLLMLVGTTVGPVKATTSILDIASWLVAGAGVLQ